MSKTDFVLSPVPMKSDDVLCEYLQYFSSIVDCNAWDDAKAAAYLRPLLGVGSHWLDDVAEKDLKSFKAICSALGDQQVPFREARCLDLMTLHMDRNETVYKFKGRVSELVEACYGGFAARNKQQLIRDFFLHRLSPDLKAAVLNTQASKLDEVVSAALMAESLRPSRAPGVPVSARIKSKGSITCFYCRKPGHIRSSCPKLSATFSKPPSDVQKYRQKTAIVSSVDVSPRFLIPVRIQNSLQFWLLDCGGQTSCLPNSMFFADMPVSSNVRVRAANGKCMNISGMRNLHFMIGNHSFEHLFTVVELPGLPILGMDLLRKMEATVDFNKGTLVFGDGETLCLTSEHDHPIPSEPDFSFKTVSPNNDSSLCSDSIHERVDEDDETSNWFIEVSRVETDCLLTASDVLQEFQDITDGRGDVGATNKFQKWKFLRKCGEKTNFGIECDKDYIYPRKSLDALAGLGLLGIIIPKEFGGLGGTHLFAAMILEAIARYGCPSTCLVYAMHVGATSSLLLRYHNNKTLRDLLKRINKEKLIGTQSYSDPATGGHFWFPMSSKTQKYEDGRVKMVKYGSWCTSSGFADFYIVQTVSPENKGNYSKLNVYLIFKDEARASASDWKSLGMHGNQSGPLTCEAILTPDRRIGPEGDGAVSNDESVDPYFLVLTAAGWNGMAMAALDLAKRHVTRKFHADTGVRVSDYPTIQDYFGEYLTSTNTVRLQVFSIAQMLDKITDNNNWALHADIKFSPSTFSDTFFDEFDSLGGYRTTDKED
ncbi:putative acyl-CoA dehydrogenase fadE25 [Nymphon striatum]|nr:putative acyl-CoA dehydrogenase fadE25 [Nymphon striatum]